MAIGNFGPGTEIFASVIASGRGAKGREDHPVDGGAAVGGQAAPADGTFLGNVHRGAGADPEAFADASPQSESGAAPAFEAGGFEIPAAGLPVALPMIPNFEGYGISVEVSGVPEDTVLSSGRSLGAGRWALDPADLDELRLQPAAAAENPASPAPLSVPGPISLGVSVAVTNSETGDVNVIPGEPVLLGPVSDVFDVDDAADRVSETAADHDSVGITAEATDPNVSDVVRYSLTDDAGGRFTIDPDTGEVTVADASLIDYEAASEHTITVQASSSDGSTATKQFTISLIDDTGEFSVSPVTDTNVEANTVSEGVADGTLVGITAFASDADGTDSVSYSLTDDAGGRFTIDSATGEVRVADASLLDFETATSHTIAVEATSTDGSTSQQDFTISLTDDTSEFNVSPVTDANPEADTLSEGVADGTLVGITAFASDADATDTVSYSLADDAGGRFTIDSATGQVRVADASLLDYETTTSHTITVEATSTDGSTSQQDFTISLTDDTGEFVVSAISDTNAAADSVSESASVGDVVGITAFASDADSSDSVSYSLTDDAGGRFAIDPVTGVVTVADPTLLDFEAANSHDITVLATSTDGSTETRTFAIGLDDDTSEFSISAVTDRDAAANTVSESAADGAVVGITAFASDADSSDTVSYSLTDDAGGRFAIDPTTGEVTVADASLLDYETARSHTITVQAQSSDGSTQTQSFTIALSDDTGEFDVSPVRDSDGTENNISENASDGDAVGITALATDADGTDSVNYSLTDDAGGRFAIDPTTGEVTVADASLLDYETATSHTITVQAESSDGSTETESFSIAVTDSNEAPTGASVAGPVLPGGSVLHLDATDVDADGSRADNPADGAAVGQWDDASGSDLDAVQHGAAPVVAKAAINGKDAIDFSGAGDAMQIADDAAINLDTYTERSYAIAFQTGDDVSGFQVIFEEGAHIRGYSLSIAEDPSNGGQPTLYAFVYNNAEWGAGDQYKAINLGPVEANQTYNVVMVHDASAADLADRTFSAYVNGDYQGTLTSVDAQYPHSGDIGVGGYLETTVNPATNAVQSGDGGEFQGLVGEVMIWNDALTEQQISETSSYLNQKWSGAPSVGENAPNGSAVFAVGDIIDEDNVDSYTFSLLDDAGGRFAIDADTGVVTVADAGQIDYETATSHEVTVRITDAGGNTLDVPVTIVVADGNDDDVGAVSDTDAAANTISEAAAGGDAVGITAFASDPGDTVTYSLTDDAGGRFAIDATTGEVTVADASLLDYETATSHTITVEAESSDGSTQTQSFTIGLSDDSSEFSVSAVSDSDGSANTVSESASDGDVVGITAFASDTDGTDSVSYSLTDDAGGRFTIDPTTGQVTVADASLLDYEAATSHAITIQAESSDGSTQTQSFSIGLSDDTSEFSVSAVSDSDGSANTVSESASDGDVVGITAFASDTDGTDSVSYSLTDDAGGRFAIDPTTGQVTVADASLLDYETATSHRITVQADSSDGSTQTQSFSIGLSDDTSEFSVPLISDTDGSANTVSESAADGAVVGITAFASDADGTDSVSYSLTDDAGGRFAIDPTTGQVTVADASLLDYETATSHTITVQAESSDGSTQTQSFSIGLSDDTSEFSVSAISDTDGGANTVSESAADGTVVGITAFASDADSTDTVSYSLTDDAGGRFAIDATTGEVTVADASLLDYETATSHTITVEAESSDGSTQTQSFTIGLADDISEFSVSAVSDTDGGANTVSESAADGTVVGITAFASDADSTDTVSYSLTDDAGGRFAIDATTGQVTVADASLLDYEMATSHTITVQAESSDGSTQAQSFTIGLSDDTSEFSVSAVSDTDAGANTVSESAADGAVVGITAFASDADGTDSVNYSLTDDAGGRFAIDPTTGQVTVADASLLDYETATSHTITVQAESSDGSTQTQSFSIGLSDDTSEFSVSAVSDADGGANTVSESAADGAVVGITAFASDADGTDSVSYSLTDDAGGRFAIDPTTGQVTVADASLLDYETATSHTITVQAESSDGSTQTQSFTIGLSDDTSEFSVSAISDTDAGANAVSESAADGAVVGITAFASDADGTDSVSYNLTDDAGGRFAIDATTGEVTVADASLLDYETATSHTITVQAESSDGSTQTQSFTIGLSDDTSEFSVSAISDTDAGANAVSESAADGAVVGITAFASDADGTDSVSYSLTDDAGGRFAIDPTTGQVTVADASLLDYETATGHTITVQAESSDGSTQTQSFTIGLTDDTSEFSVSTVSDTDGGANTVSESAADGAVVGITAFASDADGTDSVSYNLTDDAGGRFAIDPTTGQVTVADASLLDYEAATSHTITVQAESSDGSTQTQSFSIGLSDDTNEFSVSTVSDTDGGANTVSESAADGAVVGITALASDADGTDSVSYSLTDDAGGRFAIDPTTGQVTVADASLLDYETATSHAITVQAESSDGSTSTETFTINVADANEAPTDLTLSPTSAISLNANGGNNAYLSTADGGDILGGLSAMTIEVQFASPALGSGGSPLFSYHAGGGSDEIELAVYDRGATSELYIEIGENATGIPGYDANALFDGSEHQVSLTWDNATGSWEIFVDGSSVATGSGLATGQTIAAGGTIVLGQEQDSNGGGFDTNQVFSGTLHDVRVFDDVRTPAEIADNAFNQVDASESGLIADWRLDDLSGGVVVDQVSGNDLTVGNVTGPGWTGSTPSLVTGVPEGAADGHLVGTVAAADPDAGDTFTYTLDDDAGGRFAIDPTTGAVTVADTSLLDYESAASHDITVIVTDSGGESYSETFTIDLIDNTGESSASAISDTDAAADTVGEDVSNGAVVGVTAFASDADASDSITYSLTDDAGGRFAIDPTSGQVTVADASLLDYESATSHTITVQAESTDGSTQTQSFTIGLSDNTSEFSVSAVSDTDGSANTVSEGASNGDVVGMTAYASDGDASDSITYSLTDNAGGRFAIDPTSGVVTVADASLLDYETATSHTITVQAESSDGSTSVQSFSIGLSDDTSEFSISAVSDSNTTANSISENASNGDVVGITALATDADATDSVTYSLTDDAGGRFAIDPTTGVVTVADASLLDYETATSHSVTIQAESSDGSTQSQSFSIGVENVFEAGTVSGTDSSGDEDTAIALDISLSDLEGGATHTVTIAGVPSGASLSAGTDQGGGTWTLTQAQLTGLTITPPEDSGTDIQLDVTVTSDNGSGSVTSSVQTIDVTVDAVADAPVLTVEDASSESRSFHSTFELGNSSSGFSSGPIDGWSAIPGSEIETWHEDDVSGRAYEGDEFIEINYEGSGTYADAGGIERTISTEADTPYELSFQVSPRPGFESYMDFEVRAIDVSTGDVLETMAVTWDGSTVSELTWSEYTFEFTGTGGDVQLVIEDTGAVHDYGRGAYLDDIRLTAADTYVAGEAIDLSDVISVGLADTDGSETLGNVEISNIPAGTTIAVGGTPVDVTDGAVSLTSAELASGTITPPSGFNGDLYLDVSVTSTESENGDTATSTETMTISVTSDDENFDNLGSSSSNTVSGDAGDNTLYGGARGDRLYGNDGDDVLYGGSGGDRLYGGDDDDALMGGSSGDRLYGEDGNDFAYGGAGDDRLYGGDGDDTLYGGEDDDRIEGGAGNDLLVGGTGDDTAQGGDGDDTYVFGAGMGDDSFDGGGGGWTDTIQLTGKDGLTAYNGWTVTGATVVDSGENYLDLAEDSDGTITLDDGSELTFTDVDRIEW